MSNSNSSRITDHSKSIDWSTIKPEDEAFIKMRMASSYVEYTEADFQREPEDVIGKLNIPHIKYFSRKLISFVYLFFISDIEPVLPPSVNPSRKRGRPAKTEDETLIQITPKGRGRPKKQKKINPTDFAIIKKLENTLNTELTQ